MEYINIQYNELKYTIKHNTAQYNMMYNLIQYSVQTMQYIIS